MEVVELRISGFKSFVDPVRLSIEPGLTGVVGPNGCGKSNLLEAVRWVMGAASAKALRAGDMDDVIFAGAGGRPAREHAEVALVIELEPGSPLASGGEARIEVARKIRRQAGSVYRINGRETRAKDVQLLFADASTGANSPALVRQGQISELISARPENRRRVLEEAAAITGLHSRRHEADLKLSAATTNLERLSEIMAEIEGQRASLKRQARLAEKYRSVAEDIRTLESLLFWGKWRAAADALAVCEEEFRARLRDAGAAETLASAAQREAADRLAALPPLQEECLVAGGVLRRLEGERVGLERDLAEANSAIERAQSNLQRLQAEAQREEAESREAQTALTRLTQEAQGLEADASDRALPGLEAEAAEADRAAQDCEDRLRALAAAAADALAQRAKAEAAEAAEKARLARACAHLDRLESEAAQQPLDLDDLPNLAARSDEAHAQAEQAKRALAEAEARREAARRARAEAERAREELASRRTELSAESAALKRLAAPAAAAAENPAWRLLEAEPGYEKALAAALAEDAEIGMGPSGARWVGAPPRSFAWERDLEPLAPRIRFPEALAARLEASAIAPSLDAAIAAAARAPAGARIVTRDGDLARWDGLVRPAGGRQGQSSATAARFEQANRLKALQAHLAEIESALGPAEARKREASETLSAAERDVGAAVAAARKAETDAARAQAELRAAEAAERRRAEELEARRRRLSEAKAERNEAEAAARAAAAALSALVAPDDAALASARREAEQARAAAAEKRARALALSQARAQRLARRASILEEQKLWARRADAAAERLAAIDRQRAEETALLGRAEARPQAIAHALSGLREREALAETRLATATALLAEAERAARLAQSEEKAAEAAAGAAREARAGAQARLEGARSAQDSLGEHIREALGVEPAHLALRLAHVLSGPLGRLSPQDLERRAEKLRAERDAAGPVNLRAEDELHEVEIRLAGLTQEKADVEAAIAKLRAAIGKLNADARRRLQEAHRIVNGHFTALFTALFGGGQAELRLTEADDPLAAGLEIFAQPPGKRLSTLSLMSGGEQALTATALIFAVFLSNPAPICVLDEVDAPLDDANVDRFCRLLEEMRARTKTRFMVITHNPVTMARMDRLFGVTMPERGVSQIVTVDLQRAAELAAE